MFRNMLFARIVYILTVCSNNQDASLLPSGGCHCVKFGHLVTATFLVDMWRVSIYCVWYFRGTNKNLDAITSKAALKATSAVCFRIIVRNICTDM